MKLSFGLFALAPIMASLASAQDLNSIPTALGPFGNTGNVTANFDVLASFLDYTNLRPTLLGTGPFTFFAPPTDAFDDEIRNCWLRDEDGRSLLTSVLTYHVVRGSFPSSALSDGQLIPTLLDGAEVLVSIGDTVMINDATVFGPDVAASNGIIHAIDRVLFPNSTMHFRSTCPVPPRYEGNTTWEVILNQRDFGTGSFDFGPRFRSSYGFDENVEAAGLVDTLSGEGPVTFFVPTESAFEELPEGLLGCLVDDIPTLTEILNYHLVDGYLTGRMVRDGQNVTTLQGEDITIGKVSNDISDVNGIEVGPVIDGESDNGLLHTITGLLIPPSFDLAAYMEETCGIIPEDSASATYSMAFSAVAAAAAVAALA